LSLVVGYTAVSCQLSFEDYGVTINSGSSLEQKLIVNIIVFYFCSTVISIYNGSIQANDFSDRQQVTTLHFVLFSMMLCALQSAVVKLLLEDPKSVIIASLCYLGFWRPKTTDNVALRDFFLILSGEQSAVAISKILKIDRKKLIALFGL